MPINKAGSPVAVQKIKSVDILLSPKLYFSAKRILFFCRLYTYICILCLFVFSLFTFGGENTVGVPGVLEQSHPEVLGQVLRRGRLVLL